MAQVLGRRTCSSGDRTVELAVVPDGVIVLVHKDALVRVHQVQLCGIDGVQASGGRHLVGECSGQRCATSGESSRREVTLQWCLRPSGGRARLDGVVGFGAAKCGAGGAEMLSYEADHSSHRPAEGATHGGQAAFRSFPRGPHSSDGLLRGCDEQPRRFERRRLRALRRPSRRAACRRSCCVRNRRALSATRARPAAAAAAAASHATRPRSGRRERA
eukprot:scaffold663_cov358-Prasinococcus_capsulatus_cf.AAC.2